MEGIQLSLFGKTSPEHSVRQKERTSEPSSKPSAKLKTVVPLYLDLRKENGLTQEKSWETGIPSRGESSTLNTGAYPSVVEESSLWQILEANVPEKYSLSATACDGILRRAERRGKELPSLLHFALLLKSGKLFTENVDADSSFYRRLCNFAEQNECDAVIAYKPTPAIIASFMSGQGAKAGGIAYSEDLAPTITGDHENRATDYTAVVVGVDGYNAALTGEQSSTLGINCGMFTGRQAVLCVRERCGCEGGGKGLLIQDDKSGTIATSNDQFLCIALDRAVGAICGTDYKGIRNQCIDQGKIICCAVDCRNARLQDVNGTLQAKPNGGISYNLNNVVLIPCEVILRRLTPTECARLQGMPDWWCADVPHSDSAEYKMWGNGMALPCVLYVMEGVREYLDNATDA
jgi:hypothetical protein